MSKLIDLLAKQAAALNLKGDELRKWVLDREILAKAEESQKRQDDEKRRQGEIEERKRQEAIGERRRQDDEKRRQEEMEERRRQEDKAIEERRRQEAMEERRRQEDKAMEEKKMELELQRLRMEHEYKMAQAKSESDRRLVEESTSNVNRHTPGDNTSDIGLHSKIRCPTLCPSRDDCELWFLRFQELCVLTGLEEKHWATNVTEFLDPETLKTVYSMDETDRTIYSKVKNAVLVRYSYTQEGNRQRFTNYTPTSKQTFMEYVVNLQRLFKAWIKSTEMQPTYENLSDLVITSRVLDTIDPKIYSCLIEQKPPTLEALIRIGTNVCEAHGISKIVKTTVQTIQYGLSQTLVGNTKPPNYKPGQQKKKVTFNSANRRNTGDAAIAGHNSGYGYDKKDA